LTKQSITLHGNEPQGTFRVTHPFHPLLGQQFELVSVHRAWEEHRVYYYVAPGHLRSLPVSWTTIQEPDPFVATADGRSPFRIVDLLDLSRLLQDLQREADSV
jgi:hypothetical protein